MRAYTSPFDIKFKVGCNDELMSTTSTLTNDDHTEARERQKATHNWFLQQSKETKRITTRVCTTEQKLK